ncbi:hypothetical protein ACTG2N_03365 [Aeromonas hydrophila]|uniref:hypothetical protein n=1 Tax=Aeromonas hydrophila TaxID=644 RepID=UPI00256F2317|nr:hypothetical protein [Aeromonas hydrophila]MDL5385703.1 hypothetical protein [Aeromonas hydrophila]
MRDYKGHPFIGTRHSNGKFGPHINLDDEVITGLIRLHDKEGSEKRYQFPNLYPLIDLVHKQIMARFDEQNNAIIALFEREKEFRIEREIAGEYEMLFDQWHYAHSIRDKDKKSSQWDGVIKDSRQLLMKLRDKMPGKAPIEGWSTELADNIEQTGRMYTEILLFIIYARAAYEHDSIGVDPTLKKYCNQIKSKIMDLIDDTTKINLMFCAFFHREKNYDRVWQLFGIKNKGDADTILLNQIKSSSPRLVTNNEPFVIHSYINDTQQEYTRTIETTQYSNSQWDVFEVLWNIYDRVCKLEDFLAELENNRNDIDFTLTPESHKSMEGLIEQLTQKQN